MRIVGPTLPTNTLLHYGFDLEFKPGQGPLFEAPEACGYFEPAWSEACVRWPKLHPGYTPKYCSIAIVRSLALDPKTMETEGPLSVLPPGEDLLDIMLFAEPLVDESALHVFLRVTYGKKGVRAADDVFGLGALLPPKAVVQ